LEFVVGDESHHRESVNSQAADRYALTGMRGNQKIELDVCTWARSRDADGVAVCRPTARCDFRIRPNENAGTIAASSAWLR
jgi:alpha-beta hydrolase superfamily lysophospholipase